MHAPVFWLQLPLRAAPIKANEPRATIKLIVCPHPAPFLARHLPARPPDSPHLCQLALVIALQALVLHRLAIGQCGMLCSTRRMATIVRKALALAQSRNLAGTVPPVFDHPMQRRRRRRCQRRFAADADADTAARCRRTVIHQRPVGTHFVGENPAI